MSNLGAIGSQDMVRPAETAEIEAMSQEDYRTAVVSRVQELFESAKPEDQADAIRMLLAMMSKGVDCIDFAPFVVQQVVSHDAVSRQLAYVFLNHYAEEAPDAAILSVNTFQRSLTDVDPLVRASALRVLSSIKNESVLPIVHDAVKEAINDTSPYVKKAVAYAIVKVSMWDPNQIVHYLPLVQRLLGDPSPIAFSGAIAAYWTLCPDNVVFLHPHFRAICQNIKKLDEWAQILTLRALTVYARLCFKNPTQPENDEDPSKFWDEDDDRDNISNDHMLLIYAAKGLLTSLNAGVVLSAVSLLFYVAPSTQISPVARPLVRLLYEGDTTAEIALLSILTVASVYNHIFIPHLSHFFVRKGDSHMVKQLKLKVLCLLASQSNAELILKELSTYTGSSDVRFAAAAVNTMGKTAVLNEGIIPQCLVSLLKLMSTAEGSILAEIVMVIAHLLMQRRGSDDEAQALRQLCRKFFVIKDPGARSAVLSIVGDLHETHPEFAPQLLSYVASNYSTEHGRVRLQSLTLAAKLIASGTESQVPSYILSLGKNDTEYDVRDRAVFLQALVTNKSPEIQEKLRSLLCPPRPPPRWTVDDAGRADFQMGTFSHYLNRAYTDSEPLPDWAKEEDLPPETVRQGSQTAIHGDVEDGVDINDWFSNKPKPPESDYYSKSYSYSYSESESSPEPAGFD